MLIRAQGCPSKSLFLKTLSWSNSHWIKCNAEGRLPMVLKESLFLPGIWVFLWWNFTLSLFSSPCWGASVFSLPLLTDTDNSSSPCHAIFTQVHFSSVGPWSDCPCPVGSSHPTHLAPVSSVYKNPATGQLSYSPQRFFANLPYHIIPQGWGMAHVRDLTSTTC